MRFILLLFASTLALGAQGPFPEPFDTLYGNVIGATGLLIDDDDIELVIFADGIEVGNSPLVNHPTRDENYRIEVPTFAAMPDLRTYTVKLREDDQLTEVDLTFSFSPAGGALTRRDFDLRNPDIDGDMLEDAWERQYVGNLSLTKDGDPDFDGLTNRQELLAGTDPTDFSSQLNFKVIRELADGDIEIAFDVVLGRVYQVEASPPLLAWNGIRKVVAGRNERLTLVVPPFGFYRIAVELVDPAAAD